MTWRMMQHMTWCMVHDVGHDMALMVVGSQVTKSGSEPHILQTTLNLNRHNSHCSRLSLGKATSVPTWRSNAAQLKFGGAVVTAWESAAAQRLGCWAGPHRI